MGKKSIENEVGDLDKTLEKKGDKGLNPLNVRFLKAVEIVKANLEEESGKKISYKDIALSISNEPGVISRAKSVRPVSLPVLQAFCIKYDLNFNYFWRDGVELYFRNESDSDGSSMSGQISKGASATNIQIGDLKGNVFNGDVGKVIDKVVNLAPENIKDDLMEVSSTVEVMKTELIQKTEDLEKKTEAIKKIQNQCKQEAMGYQSEILSLKKKNSTLEEQLKTKNDEKSELMEKYINILEGKKK